MSKEIPFENSFASHEKAKYWSDKNKLKPNQVFMKSGKKYFFDCKCSHTFECTLDKINIGRWCPYCSNSKLCNNFECNLCFDNSFASHSKAIYWSNKNELKPNNVFKNSAKKYWFECECLHIILISLNNINNGCWCPYCSNPPKNLCNDEKCKKCFNNSFASHEKSKYWSDKNKLKPREVFKNSNTKYLFDCVCSHNFDSNLANINNGCWCPYCSNPPKNLCNDEKCKKCFNNSFASHEKSKYWSDKNKLKPREVFKKTDKKILFNCDKCYHEFIISLDNLNAGKWCPKCINKTEQKLYDKLIKLYSTLEQQFKVEWCKNKTYLPFDFIIPEYKIIIELDGLQHFKQVHNWSSPEVQEQNDKYKMKCANNNGFSIIRILQEDVFYDTYNWLKELDDNIIKIKNDKIIQNIFMCKNNENNNFL